MQTPQPPSHDWVPQRARWFVSAVGAVIVLIGGWLAVQGGITLINKLGYFVEGGYTLIFGILLVGMGIYTMLAAWGRPPPPSGPYPPVSGPMP